MKKHEIIELNGKEYTVELNRDSFLKIDQFTNFEKVEQMITGALYEYKENVEDDYDPFGEDELTIDTLNEKAEKKVAQLQEAFAKAFWIWLYPKHKLKISEVREIISKYFVEDEPEKTEFISSKYAEYIQKSTEVMDNYNERQKQLKVLANKKN